MAGPNGFTYVLRKNGDVVILHHGTTAATLRGQRARDFLAEAADGGEQETMARLTGNYKRGNERVAAEHPRNRGH